MKNCVTSRIKSIAPICKRPWTTSLTSESVTCRKHAWETVSPLWLLPLVWTSLNPIYQKISKITSSLVKICTGWIWRRLSIYFYYFAVISPWKRTYQTWYLWTLRCFVQSLVELTYSASRKKRWKQENADDRQRTKREELTRLRWASKLFGEKVLSVPGEYILWISLMVAEV